MRIPVSEYSARETGDQDETEDICLTFFWLGEISERIVASSEFLYARLALSP